VVVDFLEGDPDRPIVTGSVYNASNIGTYALPGNKTRTVLRANSTPGGGGFNELHFENKKGSEAVYLQAEKDMSVLVKNDRSQTIGGNSNTNVTKLSSQHAREIILTADDKITIVCGGSIIVLDSQGIVIKGARVDINP
jgi:type VI secretion system secreted protein VgrG